MGCGKAFPLFKVTKWPWFVAWGWEDFFSFFGGGGESCSIQVDCKGDHDQSSSTEYMSGNNRKLTIYLLPVEGEAGAVAVTRILQRFMGRSGKLISWHNQIPLPLPLANTAMNDWSRGESLSSERNCYYHFENIYQHFLLTFLRPRKWTLTSTSLVMNSGLKYVFLIGTTASSSSSSSLMHWGLTSMSSWFNSTFVLLSGNLIKSSDSSHSPHSVDRVGKE